jgi:hypothetical protein
MILVRGSKIARSAGRWSLPALAATFGLALGGQAIATAATYDFVNYPLDQNGWTLSGTMTTDGVIGAFQSSDVTSWTIRVSKGATAHSFSSTSLGAKLLVGSSATATATTITSNYQEDQFLFLSDADSINWAGQYIGFADGAYLWDALPPTSFPPSGVVTIAAAAVPAPVPESATWALFGIGFGALATMRAIARRRREPRTV